MNKNSYILFNVILRKRRGKLKKRLLALTLTLITLLCACTSQSEPDVTTESEPVVTASPEVTSTQAQASQTTVPSTEPLTQATEPVTYPEPSAELPVIDDSEKKLPVVNIVSDTAYNSISRNDYSPCTVSIDCSAAQGYESLPEVSAQIRGRGNSTWRWQKKPFKIKLDEKAEVLGLDAAKEWVLLSNYADKSLMRNTVAFAMSDYLGTLCFTPASIPVELYFNGEYLGVYALGEQLEVKSGRVELEKEADGNKTSFFIEIGGVENGVDKKDKDYFHTPTELAEFLLIKSPDTQTLPKEQFDYIKNTVIEIENSIIDGSYDEYINVDTFIDWWLITELSFNLDSCFNRSCYLVKDRDEKLEMGPVWDFDHAFGNFVMDWGYEYRWCILGEDPEDAYIRTNWYNYLLKDKAFRERAAKRWNEVKDGLVYTALSTIDECYTLIKPSADDNFSRWAILDKVAGYEREDVVNYNTYELQVEYLKNFIITRSEWITNNIELEQ